MGWGYHYFWKHPNALEDSGGFPCIFSTPFGTTHPVLTHPVLTHRCQVETASDGLTDSDTEGDSIGSIGLVYLPTWMVDCYGWLLGKYTSPMDPMGMDFDSGTICLQPVLLGSRKNIACLFFWVAVAPKRSKTSRNVKDAFQFWAVTKWWPNFWSSKTTRGEFSQVGSFIFCFIQFVHVGNILDSSTTIRVMFFCFLMSYWH